MEEQKKAPLAQLAFRTGMVRIRVNPNYLTVQVIEQNDPEPTTLWISAVDILGAFGEHTKKHGN